MALWAKKTVRRTSRLACSACLAASAALPALPQTPTAQIGSGSPIAVVPLGNESSDGAASVTGALEVTDGKAIIASSGTVTSGSHTTSVVLPRRGVLRVCAATTVKLAADASVPAGDDPGLLIAMDHGAIETSFATGRNADVLLTPDFRILIGGPGSSELKVRLGRDGDTCVDNSGVPSDRSSPLGLNAPYVVVTSLFDSGLYRVQPGQHVMFQHGSLHEVVDQETEPCGCPPAPTKPGSNEFPLAQSEGLAPTPTPAPAPKQPGNLAPESTAPLVHTSPASAPQVVPAPPPNPAPVEVVASSPVPSPKAPAAKKPGLFKKIGHFFRRLFGAE